MEKCLEVGALCRFSNFRSGAYTASDNAPARKRSSHAKH